MVEVQLLSGDCHWLSLLEVMAYFCQATNHHLSQSWPRSMSPLRSPFCSIDKCKAIFRPKLFYQKCTRLKAATTQFYVSKAWFFKSEQRHFQEVTSHCPACRTFLIATRFWVVMICPIIKCLTVSRVFFYFVWFVFIHHNFQFYFELCTYCNILDIYLS